MLCLAPGFDCWARNDACYEMILLIAVVALAYVMSSHLELNLCWSLGSKYGLGSVDLPAEGTHTCGVWFFKATCWI